VRWPSPRGIYLNSGEPWNAGCVAGYDRDRPFPGENLRLATLLQDDVLGAMNAQGWDIPDGGVLPDTGLGSALTAAAVAYGHLHRQPYPYLPRAYTLSVFSRV
jgi:hypothetical protein